MKRYVNNPLKKKNTIVRAARTMGFSQKDALAEAEQLMKGGGATILQSKILLKAKNRADLAKFLAVKRKASRTKPTK